MQRCHALRFFSPSPVGVVLNTAWTLRHMWLDAAKAKLESNQITKATTRAFRVRSERTGCAFAIPVRGPARRLNEAHRLRTPRMGLHCEATHGQSAYTLRACNSCRWRLRPLLQPPRAGAGLSVNSFHSRTQAGCARKICLNLARARATK